VLSAGHIVMPNELLRGQTLVESVDGIAEYSLVYTGGKGDYYLFFNFSHDNQTITGRSGGFYIDPSVARLEFESFPTGQAWPGNDIIWPYPRVRLLDAEGNMVDNSVLKLRIDLVRNENTPPAVRIIGNMIEAPIEGPAIVEFDEIATVAPLTIVSTILLDLQVSTLPEHSEFAVIDAVVSSFSILFPGSIQLIQEELQPPPFYAGGYSLVPAPMTITAGEWFPDTITVLIKDNFVLQGVITESQRTVTARVENLTACNAFGEVCLEAKGGYLSGTTAVTVENGVAVFTQLRIFFSGRFSLIFESSLFGDNYLRAQEPVIVTVESAPLSKLELYRQPEGAW
jgi:hypothetical protein